MERPTEMPHQDAEKETIGTSDPDDTKIKTAAELMPGIISALCKAEIQRHTFYKAINPSLTAMGFKHRIDTYIPNTNIAVLLISIVSTENQ